MGQRFTETETTYVILLLLQRLDNIEYKQGYSCRTQFGIDVFYR